jgi:hypothetical protein
MYYQQWFETRTTADKLNTYHRFNSGTAFDILLIGRIIYSIFGGVG